MEQISKTGASPGCIPVSTNCVIWNGPDIPALKLCKGDNISKVVYNLAKKLLETTAGVVDITSLDFKCLLEAMESKPTTLVATLQKIINKTCTLQSAIETGTTGGTGTGSNPVLLLPSALHYTDADGDKISSLVHTEYSKKLAEEIAKLIGSITEYKTKHDALVGRVVSIERVLNELQQDAGELTVQLKCLGTPGSYPFATAVSTLEDGICNLRGVLGSDTELLAAINLQMANLGDLMSLVDKTKLMKDLSGFTLLPKKVSHTLGNMWVTMNDVRGAVVTLSGQIRATCADVFIDFQFNVISGRSKGELKLAGFAIVPSNFVDAGTSTLVVSDGVTSKSFPINVVTLTKEAGSVFTADLTANGIDTTKALTVTVNAKLLDGTTACDKTKTKTTTVPCDNLPVGDVTSSLDYTSASIGWTAPASVDPILSYNLVVEKNNGDGTFTSVYNQNVNTTSVNVTGLTQNTGYVARVKAKYACGDSSVVNHNFITPICNSATVKATMTNALVSKDGTMSVNGTAITKNEPALVVITGCDGVATIDYAIPNIAGVKGELYVDLVKTGDTLAAGSTVLNGSLVLNIVAGGTKTVEFKIFE